MGKLCGSLSGNLMMDIATMDVDGESEALGLISTCALITSLSRTKLIHIDFNPFDLEECKDDEFTLNTLNSYFLIKNNA